MNRKVFRNPIFTYLHSVLENIGAADRDLPSNVRRAVDPKTGCIDVCKSSNLARDNSNPHFRGFSKLHYFSFYHVIKLRSSQLV